MAQLHTFSSPSSRCAQNGRMQSSLAKEPAANAAPPFIPPPPRKVGQKIGGNAFELVAGIMGKSAAMSGNMEAMVAIKGHFDGKAVILDEPASLKVGQAVRVIIERPTERSESAPVTPGSWKGKLRIIDERDEVILDHFKDYLP